MLKKAFITACILILMAGYAFAQIRDLQTQISEAEKNGDMQAAIDLAHKLIELDPGGHYYKLMLTTYYARAGQLDTALEKLKVLIDDGFTDYRTLMRDSDLEPLKMIPGYMALVERAKEAAVREVEEKTVVLEEGEWHPLTLRGAYTYPDIKLALRFDHEKLEIKADVSDLHFKDGNRSWRYGDGFFINFVTPEDTIPGYSSLFYAYGFSMYQGKPGATLINKDGTYYLGGVKDLRPEITIDPDNKKAHYHITIPWHRLYPFQPLLHQTLGMNIRYTSQNDDGSRKRIYTVPDLYHDAEGMNLRRYVPFRFNPSEKSKFQMAGELKTRLIDSPHAEVELAVWSPKEIKGRLTVSLSKDKKIVKQMVFDETLKKGKNIFRKKLELPDEKGMVHLKMAFDKTTAWEETFFTYNSEKWEAFKKDIAMLAAQSGDLRFQNSLDGLTYRIETLEKSIKAYTNRQDPAGIEKEFGQLKSLAEEVKAERSIYTEPGYLLSAFRSPLDATLQPFSLYLPKNFDPSKSYVMVVGLHGSGVSEVGFLRWSARSYTNENYIMVGPRGRDLSAWYLGDTETDVADLVRLIKEMFFIEKTMLYGFSMGGYGVWRMSFLHPELFDAAICISGPPSPERGDPLKNDMRNFIGQGKNLKYLVIHGTEDRAVEIQATDEFMEKLKAAGYDLEYVRVEGGGHGNFDTLDMVKKWLDANF